MNSNFGSSGQRGLTKSNITGRYVDVPIMNNIAPSNPQPMEQMNNKNNNEAFDYTLPFLFSSMGVIGILSYV